MKAVRPMPWLFAAAMLASLGAHAQEPKSADAEFQNAQGEKIGTAKLTQTPHGVLISIDLTELPPGEHALHFHEKGVCDPKDGFKSAGGHFAPMKKEHGYLVEKGHHAGDMPNQFVAPDGRLQTDVFNPDVKLTSSSLLDKDGSAIVVHAKPDDYRSQPAGDAGDRIACAVVKAP